MKWVKGPRDLGVLVESPKGQKFYSTLPRNVRKACSARAWELSRHKRRSLYSGPAPTPVERSHQRDAFDECRAHVEIFAKARFFAGDDMRTVLRAIEGFEGSDEPPAEGFASRVSHARVDDSDDTPSRSSRATQGFETVLRRHAWAKT